MNCNRFSSYDYDSLSLNELVCQHQAKINELVDSENEFLKKVDAGYFKGDKGDVGPAGPQGPQGEKGEKGDPGRDTITTERPGGGTTYITKQGKFMTYRAYETFGGDGRKTITFQTPYKDNSYIAIATAYGHDNHNTVSIRQVTPTTITVQGVANKAFYVEVFGEIN